MIQPIKTDNFTAEFPPSILAQHSKFSKGAEALYTMDNSYRFSILRGIRI